MKLSNDLTSYVSRFVRQSIKYLIKNTPLKTGSITKPKSFRD